ncbi:hypothetical protein NTG1052_90040 [Candidatus Nitrotoga sp. 1052]|nr:hypothetical protein NTG1052_90040 [Candidatus Nitrotoga sp. 1052]
MTITDPEFAKLGMIANAQPKIQIVDTHELPGTLSILTLPSVYLNLTGHE